MSDVLQFVLTISGILICTAVFAWFVLKKSEDKFDGTIDDFIDDPIDIVDLDIVLFEEPEKIIPEKIQETIAVSNESGVNTEQKEPDCVSLGEESKIIRVTPEQNKPEEHIELDKSVTDIKYSDWGETMANESLQDCGQNDLQTSIQEEQEGSDPNESAGKRAHNGIVDNMVKLSKLTLYKDGEEIDLTPLDVLLKPVKPKPISSEYSDIIKVLIREAKQQALVKSHRLECPFCKKEYDFIVGENKCPYCGELVNFIIKFDECEVESPKEKQTTNHSNNLNIDEVEYKGIRFPKNQLIIFPDEEIAFLDALVEKLQEFGINPSNIHMTRNEKNYLSFSYAGLCCLGIALIGLGPIRYAVVKYGNAKPTKIFDTEQEARDFVAFKEPLVGSDTYYIEEHTKGKRRIQYQEFRDDYNFPSEIFWLKNISLKECIDTIPKWIEYIIDLDNYKVSKGYSSKITH